MSNHSADDFPLAIGGGLTAAVRRMAEQAEVSLRPRDRGRGLPPWLRATTLLNARTAMRRQKDSKGTILNI